MFGDFLNVEFHKYYEVTIRAWLVNLCMDLILKSEH